MTQKELLSLTVRRPAILAIMAFVIAALLGPNANLTSFYLHRQDRWLLLVAALLLVLCAWRLPARSQALTGGRQLAFAVGAVMAFAAFAGHYGILSGYDLSRDEQMANFDAAVFAQWRLVAPLTGIWRDHADALNTMFMYPTNHTAGWISAYLPLNGAFRAFFGLLGDTALTGPAMLLIGAVALWGCTQRIWPDDREAGVVALLLYLGSGQILFNGMTAYAMPAHLALNLCWLWLFLRRTIWADATALTVGFVAVGLHQPIMHPMFAAPILFLLVLERDWRRAAFYLGGYAVIGAFWAWWPTAMWQLVEADAMAPRGEGVDYISRLVATVLDGDAMRVANMMSNIVRFFAWQHLLLLPLLLWGIAVARKDRLAGALMGGILLTTTVMFIILPYQGHGFGYRYLHGLIGNFILLAVYGWGRLDDALSFGRNMLLRTTVAALFVTFPLQAWMAHAFYAPAARASERIAKSGADYVAIGADDAPFMIDLVVNSPDLVGRPIRLVRGSIDLELAQALCTSQSAPLVVFAGEGLLQPIRAAFGFDATEPGAQEANQGIGSLMREFGCQTAIIE
ncbi:hypothetical protein MNQ96_07555 [Sphingopyxis granuli]|uniref:hypothetical protein n=1 Tax=Sphingopyxis granuli TaxID=267128 RepID=UPI001F52F3AD|nr:hypothetical protein [Sphingopyxis granuli]UNK80919.1 hypothetical protein MNQ96_07555 [Sphingopyxis granuli]